MDVWGRVRFGRPLDDGKGGPHQGRDKKESSKVGRQRFNPSHKHVKHKVPSEPRARKTQGSIRATNTKNTGQIFKARTSPMRRRRSSCTPAPVGERQNSSSGTGRAEDITAPCCPWRNEQESAPRPVRPRAARLCSTVLGHELWVTQRPFWNSLQACFSLTSVFALSVLGACLAVRRTAQRRSRPRGTFRRP